MMESLIAGGEAALHELALFAAIGFLLLGLSDISIDLIWIVRTIRRWLTIPHHRLSSAINLPPPIAPGRIAIFLPAWDESAVIVGMLSYARATLVGDYRIYVGCYPNDPATIASARTLADDRIRLVVGHRPGPTSKADCLNGLWAQMLADEVAEGRRFKAIVLHDAEDVVHSAELGIFDTLIERFDLVQLPVVPLIDPTSRWVAGHYADEFAESHGKELVVREVLGAGLPSAGVGCAISRDALDRLARAHGMPFDSASLTEDYELGLKLRGLGGRAAFIRLPAGPGRPAVSTREYFPHTLGAAVAQKARWMTGIALAGWERLGWQGGFAERWMRLRDRQSVFAALVLVAAYGTLVLWSVLFALEWAVGRSLQPVSSVLSLLLTLNSGLLVWRLSMRFGFVTRCYGWREGLRSLPRVIVGNIIAMMAARRAVVRYLMGRQTGAAIWDKTAHAFPARLPAE